jgi:hypothetical protein
LWYAVAVLNAKKLWLRPRDGRWRVLLLERMFVVASAGRVPMPGVI